MLAYVVKQLINHTLVLVSDSEISINLQGLCLKLVAITLLIVRQTSFGESLHLDMRRSECVCEFFDRGIFPECL